MRLSIMSTIEEVVPHFLETSVYFIKAYNVAFDKKLSMYGEIIFYILFKVVSDVSHNFFPYLYRVGRKFHVIHKSTQFFLSSYDVKCALTRTSSNQKGQNLVNTAGVVGLSNWVPATRGRALLISRIVVACFPWVPDWILYNNSIESSSNDFVRFF